MRTSTFSSSLLVAALAATTLAIGLLPQGPLLAAERIVSLHTMFEATSSLMALLIFSVGWQTYSTNRTWPITLFASVFFGVGLFELAHMMSFPGMADWLTPNSEQKAEWFAVAARLLTGIALLIAAGTATLGTLPAAAPRWLLGAVIAIALAIYPAMTFNAEALPDLLDARVARVAHGILLLTYLASAALLLRHVRKPGFSWTRLLLGGSLIMALAEINYAQSRTAGDSRDIAAHIMLICSWLLLYRSVFMHSIQLPIDEMNAWKARLRSSQRELNITKLAVDGSGYYIFMYDDRDNLLYASDNACQRLGMTTAELNGRDRSHLSILSGDLALRDWSLLQQQGYLVFEDTMTTRSGEQFPVEVTVTRIEEESEQRFCVIVHDITERKRYEVQREENSRQLRRVLDSMPYFVTVLAADGTVLDINQTLIKNLRSFEPDAARGMPYMALMRNFLLDGNSEKILNAALDRARAGESARCDIGVGNEQVQEYLECSIAPIKADDGTIVNIIVTGVYITERIRTQNQLRLASTVFDHSAEAILITDGAIRTLSVNRAFTDITGYGQDEMIGTVPALFEQGAHRQAMLAELETAGDWSGEVEWLSKDGQLCYEWLTVTKVHDGDGVSNYIVIFSDISEKKRAEEHIQYLAYYDPLTNLPNRVLLEDRIKQAIATAKREASKIAVIFLDLDHFKTINDSLGHQRGDKILTEVGKRLKRCVREQDTVARLGGDEFVIMLPGLHAAEEVGAINRKLLAELALPYFIGDSELRLTVSIGVSIYPDDGIDFSRLIMNADAAMYHAKDSGRNNAQFFIGEMNRRAAELLSMENHLRRAIEREEFLLHFQPQVDLRSGTIVGFEALVRWHDPERGLIAPGQFIPVAEERGLIAQIGLWVLREACRQNRAWQDAGLPKLKIAVNISVSQFRDRKLVENVQAVLRETGLDPQYLELEVTESTVMYDAEQLISTLEELRGIGVFLAVDDFGTGYSSLSYLKRFPIDKIKIDRSFIRDIPGDKDDHSIVRAIIDLSRQLNLKVIAEGVETIEQLDALRESGCDQFQGFYFSRPLPMDAAEQLLREGRQLR